MMVLANTSSTPNMDHRRMEKSEKDSLPRKLPQGLSEIDYRLSLVKLNLTVLV